MRSTDEQQRHREETVRALLNATGESIYGVDLDGNCTFANPSCVRSLGCELEGAHKVVVQAAPDAINKMLLKHFGQQ